jgi:hypothetical protein
LENISYFIPLIFAARSILKIDKEFKKIEKQIHGELKQN